MLERAGKVLVLLTEGVLRGEPLSRHVDAIAFDRAAGRDRLLFVCQTQEEGWQFGNGNPDVAAAPREVRDALNDHEAITFRAPNQASLAGEHEFRAMVDHLLLKVASPGRRRPFG